MPAIKPYIAVSIVDYITSMPKETSAAEFYKKASETIIEQTEIESIISAARGNADHVVSILLSILINNPDTAPIVVKCAKLDNNCRGVYNAFISMQDTPFDRYPVQPETNKYLIELIHAEKSKLSEFKHPSWHWHAEQAFNNMLAVHPLESIVAQMQACQLHAINTCLIPFGVKLHDKDKLEYPNELMKLGKEELMPTFKFLSSIHGETAAEEMLGKEYAFSSLSGYREIFGDLPGYISSGLKMCDFHGRWITRIVSAMRAENAIHELEPLTVASKKKLLKLGILESQDLRHLPSLNKNMKIQRERLVNDLGI